MLDKILHPPRGSWSTLQSSGEVLSLWTKVSKPSPALKKKTFEEWAMNADRSRSEMIAPNTSVESQAEYDAGQELMAQGRNAEALAHYEKAAQLSPRSSFAWQQLGQARWRASDFAGSKAAMIRSYREAFPDKRPSLVHPNRLTKEDIRVALSLVASPAPERPLSYAKGR